MPHKVFIVTGASKGLGAAVAKHLLGQSHKVVLAARSAAPLAALQKAHPGQVEYLAGDMTDPAVRTVPFAPFRTLLSHETHPSRGGEGVVPPWKNRLT